MEEPVHDDEQDDHGEQPGRRLHREPARAELAEHPGGEEPGGDAGEEAGRRAERDRPAVDLGRADHAGGDRGEHEDRLQPLAEDEQGAVEHHGAVAEVIPGRRFGGAAVRVERAPGK